VNTNKKTDYRAFSLLYRYAYIRLGMNNKEYTIQPFDLGGTPLPPGRYTYKLTYLPSSDQLSLQLIQD
jgi:hypothetical protein